MNLPLSLILILFMIMTSCHKEKNTEGCIGFPLDDTMRGYSIAKGSYRDYNDFAQFEYKIERDSLSSIEGKPSYINDKSILSLTLYKTDDNCIIKEFIGISNIPARLKDTINLIFSYGGLSKEYPTSAYIIIDDDAIIEEYHLLEGEGISNWLSIESINSDTTEIKGRFQLSYVTAYEEYLNGERERWDDPNRPDTLHFTEGEFRAEVIDR